MTPENLNLIWAQDSSGVIGINGQIPWSVPEDLSHFQQITMGNYVVMGTKTYLSLLQRPLSQRINVIIGKTFAHNPWKINYSVGFNIIETVQYNSSVRLQDILAEHGIVCPFISLTRSALSIISDQKEFLSATMFFSDISSWINYQQWTSLQDCETFIIGGENIYVAFMPLAQRLYITQIAYDSGTAMGQDEIYEIAYAPIVPSDFHGEWLDWNRSSSGLTYRFGFYGRELFTDYPFQLM